jgi:hypothetical protein
MSSQLDGKNLAVKIGYPIHNSRIDKSGRYVTIALTGEGGWWAWDLQSGSVTHVTAAPYGHRVAGWGTTINHSAKPGDEGPQWVLRSLEAGKVNAPENLLPVHPNGPFWPYGSHLSWANVKPGNSGPVLVCTYLIKPPDPHLPLGEEIFALATDGSGRIWRFAHHRSTYDGNFWTTPRGNVSPDGEYYIFTSNWEKSLGTDKTGSARTDVFLLHLPQGT